MSWERVYDLYELAPMKTTPAVEVICFASRTAPCIRGSHGCCSSARCLLFCSFCLFISNFFRFALLLLLLLCILNSQRQRVVIVSSFMRTTCVCVCVYAICTKMCVRYMLQTCTEALFERVQINRVSGCRASLRLPACCCCCCCSLLHLCDSTILLPYFFAFIYVHFPLLSPVCSVLTRCMGAQIIFFFSPTSTFFLATFFVCLVALLPAACAQCTHRRARFVPSKNEWIEQQHKNVGYIQGSGDGSGDGDGSGHELQQTERVSQ